MKGKEAACDGRCLLRVVHLTAQWVHQHKQFVHKFRFLVSAAVIFKDINRFSFCLMFYCVSTGVFWQILFETYAAWNHLSVNSMPCSLLHSSTLDLA